jgi:hypothetical protein
MSLRRMAAEWTPCTLLRPNLDTLHRIVALLHDHLFDASVHSPKAGFGGQAILAWEYLAHQEVYLGRDAAGRIRASASSFALDLLTQLTFSLDLISAMTVLHMREWTAEQKAMMDTLLRDIFGDDI